MDSEESSLFSNKTPSYSLAESMARVFIKQRESRKKNSKNYLCLSKRFLSPTAPSEKEETITDLLAKNKNSIPASYHSKIRRIDDIDIKKRCTPRKYAFLHKSFGHKKGTSTTLLSEPPYKARSRNNMSSMKRSVLKNRK
ncbi:unnamed protein product [Moneuplotes crassus]|uniref:Uncharacterized protein n=1 Tax=Euplotes crassus TaxID=5936 RepID=A0AAD1USJ0_EUPCR|nr:unnamed protein product [Moneuplotes crassus]